MNYTCEKEPSSKDALQVKHVCMFFNNIQNRFCYMMFIQIQGRRSFFFWGGEGGLFGGKSLYHSGNDVQPFFIWGEGEG